MDRSEIRKGLAKKLAQKLFLAIGILSFISGLALIVSDDLQGVFIRMISHYEHINSNAGEDSIEIIRHWNNKLIQIGVILMLFAISSLVFFFYIRSADKWDKQIRLTKDYMIKNPQLIVWAVVICYSCLVFSGILYHEPHMDEAQAWLLARDLDLPGLFHQLSYEGSPGLWHLILFCLSNLGFPYISMQLIHGLIAIAAVYVFMKKSSFSTFFKIAFVFSYYMAFDYAVVARNYSIGILLLFLIISIYENRIKKPWIFASLLFLFFNTNVHSLATAFTLLVIYIYDIFGQEGKKIKYIPPALLMISGLVLAVIQLIPAGDNINAGIVSSMNFRLPFSAMSSALIPFSGRYLPDVTVYFFPLIFLLFIFSLIKNPRVFFIILLSFIWLVYLGLFKEGTIHARHFGLFLIFLISGLWLNEVTPSGGHKKADVYLFNIDLNLFRNKLMFILTLCQIISVLFAYRYFEREFRYDYCGGKDVARYINNSMYKDYTIAATDYCAISPLPYLPDKQLWVPVSDNYQTFITWNEQSKFAIGEEELNDALKEKMRQGDKIIVLSAYERNNISLQLIYSSPRLVFGYGSNFYIYKIKPETN